MAGIRRHGSLAGIVLNLSKTMVDEHVVEINSTVFRDGAQLKKTNLRALQIGFDADDVLGLALEGTVTVDGFCNAVLRNRKILQRQRDKRLDFLPLPHRTACLRHPKIRNALTSGPRVCEVKEANLLPVVPQGDYGLVDIPGFAWTRDDEVRVIREEVALIRSQRTRPETGQFVPLPRVRNKVSVRAGMYSLREVKRPKRVAKEKSILQCLSRAYWTAVKQAVMEGKPEWEKESGVAVDEWFSINEGSWYATRCREPSTIERLSLFLKGHRSERPGATDDPPSQWGDFVDL